MEDGRDRNAHAGADSFEDAFNPAINDVDDDRNQRMDCNKRKRMKSRKLMNGHH